jgi:hypothetical protein
VIGPPTLSGEGTLDGLALRGLGAAGLGDLPRKMARAVGVLLAVRLVDPAGGATIVEVNVGIALPEGFRDAPTGALVTVHR